MDSFLSEEESPEIPERKDQPPPRRLKRGSRLSRGKRSSVSSLPQTTQNQRRESFFSDDEAEGVQTQKVVQAITKTASQLSQAEKPSYLSSSEDSDDDSVRIAETSDAAQNQTTQPAAWLGDEAAKNMTVRVMKRQQKQDHASEFADRDSKLANGSIPAVAVKSGDYDTAAALETSSDQVSIENISDVHTSVPSAQDPEGSEDTSRQGSSVRQETDSCDPVLDHNTDDLVNRIKSMQSTDFATSVSFKAARSDSDYADSPILKSDTKELDSLHEKFDEFATEQRRLSDSLCKALESERHAQVEELKKYMDVVGDLTRMLEEERETREAEARSHEALLEERFRQQEEKWQSEIANLQAEISQLREGVTPPIASPWIASKTILDGLELISTSPAADNASGSTRMEASLPDTPQSRDNSRSVDTFLTITASPAASKLHNGSDAINPLLFSGDVSRIGSENADLDTPGSHVLPVLHRGDWPAQQRQPGTVRLQTASPTLADKLHHDRGGVGNLNIWSRSLADDLVEEDTAQGARGKTISGSANIERAAAALGTEHSQSQTCGEALVNGSSPPYLWPDQTILPPPVRVPAASQKATQPRGDTDGERCLTPQRMFRAELPSSSASNALGNYLVHSAETASANFVPSLSGRTAPLSFVAHRPR